MLIQTHNESIFTSKTTKVCEHFLFFIKINTETNPHRGHHPHTFDTQLYPSSEPSKPLKIPHLLAQYLIKTSSIPLSHFTEITITHPNPHTIIHINQYPPIPPDYFDSLTDYHLVNTFLPVRFQNNTTCQHTTTSDNNYNMATLTNNTTTGTSTTPPRPSPFAPSTWASTQHYSWLKSLDTHFDSFLWRLKRRDLTSSSQFAVSTAKLFQKYLTEAAQSADNVTVNDILTLFREMAQVLTTARHVELVVGNTVRRVLHAIRHEAIVMSLTKDGQTPTSEQVDLIENSNPFLNPVYSDKGAYKDLLLSSLIEAITGTIEEIIETVDATDKEVGKFASEQIFPNEVILTYGFSKTLQSFLRYSRKENPDRPFQVYVAETAPSLSGRSFAQALATSGISVTLIPDSDIFTIMPVVTKVFIGAHAVLANGGVLAMTGAGNLSLAAAHHQVPVIVLCGLHKISPQYAFDQGTYNEHNPPAQVLQFDDCLEGRIDVVNPSLDYVTPDNIHLFITDNGPHPPQCIYRNLAELYSVEDYDLTE